MSGIFGLFNLTGEPVEPQAMQTMHEAMVHWGPDGNDTWSDGPVGLGQLLLYNTPEALHERLPRWVPEQGIALTAAARIDNRDELCDLFGIPDADRHQIADSELILRAYQRWGQDCPDHLLGDWSFAIWNPAERRLFLARDHCGYTALYYFFNQQFFAFASSKKALLALAQVPQQLNELRLAQILVAWQGDGVQTVHDQVFRLPQAHTLTITPQQLSTHRYWYLEDTPLMRYRSSEEYVEGLSEVLTQAVHCRLRSYRPIGVFLSGGLDSGTVAVTAARMLAQEGRRLPAYSSVPLYDVTGACKHSRIGDESPYIEATAEAAATIDVQFLCSETISPIAGIRWGMEVLDAPSRWANSLYWILDLLQAAQQDRAGTVLTGEGGNWSISWPGQPWLRTGQAAQQQRDWRLWFGHDVLPPLKHKILQLLRPKPVTQLYPRLRKLRLSWEETAIQPDFADRIWQADLWYAFQGPPSALHWLRNPYLARIASIAPGRAVIGALWAELGAACGLEVRAPAWDKRVLEYCLAVPNRYYTGPDGADRYLLRRAMSSQLPSMVVDNLQRGRVGADLVARLVAHKQEMEVVLQELKDGTQVGNYIDLPRLQEVWSSCRSEPMTDRQNRQAVHILIRGLMAGLFVKDLEA